MITLGIETSCDETACGVVRNGRVLSNVVSSSVHLHASYGGVVPEIASRYHIEYINAVVKKALRNSRLGFKNLDLIAVTNGPGLCGSLLVGISFAKALSLALSVPILGINHLRAHLFANFIEKNNKNMPRFPFIGLVISGGHTNIFLFKDINDFKVLGNTQDDAVGEAFDKVAKMLKLGYPGGPIIEKSAKRSLHTEIISFPKTYLNKDSLDFSFSGIKTAVLYYIKNKKLTKKMISKISYSFQESVFDVIIEKVLRACEKYKINTVVIGGGVACNKRFHEKIKRAFLSRKISIFIPKVTYCLDNGAMVASLGESLFKKGYSSRMDMSCATDLGSLA